MNAIAKDTRVTRIRKAPQAAVPAELLEAVERANNTNEAADEIRAFLASVLPIRGCSYDSDRRFHMGRSLIERIALSSDRQSDNVLALRDISAVVHYLSNIESADKEHCYGCHGGVTSSGHNRVLEALVDDIDTHCKHVASDAEVTEPAQMARDSECSFSDALNDVQLELSIARSGLDVLHDVFATGDDCIKESVASGMCGLLFGILQSVRRAEEAAAKAWPSAR